MAINQTNLRSVFANLVGQLPTTCTFGSLTFTATRTNLNAEKRLVAAGELAGYQFSIIAGCAVFTSYPTSDDIITIDSVEYRVLRTERDAADVAIRIDLGDKYA